MSPEIGVERTTSSKPPFQVRPEQRLIDYEIDPAPSPVHVVIESRERGSEVCKPFFQVVRHLLMCESQFPVSWSSSSPRPSSS